MSKFQEPFFSCCSDCGICLMGCCVPCLLQAQAVEKATGESCAVPYLIVCCLLCIGGGINRTKIRDTYKIQGSLVEDIFLWFCCGSCAVCQEYKEAHRRSN